MKTIIAPVYLHEYLKFSLIKKNQTNYLLDYKFTTIEGFLADFLEDDKDNLITIKQLLENCNITIFKSNLQQPAFIDYIFKMYKKILLNQLDIQRLADDNASNHELKILLNALKNTKIKENSFKTLYKQLSEINFSDFYIYNIDIDLDYQPIIDIMLQNQATCCQLTTTKANYDVFIANNYRDEIEYVAQDIIENKYQLQDVNIVITNKEYEQPLKQVFEIYNLDNGFTQITTDNQTNYKFTLLIKLYLEPSIENYYQAIINNCFGILPNQEFIIYIKNYLCDFKACLNSFNYFQNQSLIQYQAELEKLISIEKQANLYQEQIVPLLNNLMQCKTIETLLITTFEILKKAAVLSELKQLKSKILLYYQDLTFDNLTTFLYILPKSLPSSESFTNKICVTTLKKAVPARKVTYVIGCSQKNYPGFKLNTGYFNQQYLDTLGYYNQQQQFTHHQKSLAWIFKSGEKINFLAPSTTLAGKAIDIAYDIETLVKKVNYVNTITNNFEFKKSHQLTIPNANKAFIKDNNIYGSVSSYEKYFLCPYRYFLNYGLKLYPEQLMEIKANTFGSLIHDLFKTIVSNNPKHYADDLDYQKIISLTNPYFEELKILFLKNTKELANIQIKLAQQLSQAMLFYKDLEANTLYQPTLFEHKITSPILTKNNITINIKGYIDRIDHYNTGFRIIDYKSSNNTILSDKDFLSAEKLQLATYTVIYKKITNLTPYGCYYAYYKSPKNSAKAYSYSASGIKSIDQEYLDNEYYKNYKLSGFNFYYDPHIDNGKHLKQIRNNKLIGKPYNFDNIEKILCDIYSYLIDNLSSGNISLTPRENACTYCDYQSICNFNGKQIKYPKLFADKSLLKEEKEDE